MFCLLYSSIAISQDDNQKRSSLPPVRLEPERLRLTNDSYQGNETSAPDALTEKNIEGYEEKDMWDEIIDPTIIQEEILSRHFLGAGLSYSNNGVTRGMYSISDDTILKGNVSEKMFNIFLLVDLGWNEAAQEAFRIRWGLGRAGINIPDDIRSNYTSGVLEEQLTLMTLDFTLKTPLSHEDEMFYWWGAGLNLHYAFSSQTAASGGVRESQLRHSSSISPVLSIGMDVNTDGPHQVIFQGDWILLKSFQFSAGIRTRL